jgi:hypothetical protein
VDTPIRRFKQARRLTYRQLAALLGISHDYARKLGCGSVRTLSPRLARQIEKRTGGEIRAVDLIFPERASRAAGALNARARVPGAADRSRPPPG